MDDDLEGEFVTVHLLQLMLAGEQQDEFEDEFFKLSCVRLMCYGLEEARHNRVSRHSSQCLSYSPRPSQHAA